MEKIKNWPEVIDLLRSGDILLNEEGSIFKRGNKGVVIYQNGSRFHLTIDDFRQLYEHSTFFEYEDKTAFIDPLKDEEYYRFKHK